MKKRYLLVRAFFGVLVAIIVVICPLATTSANPAQAIAFNRYYLTYPANAQVHCYTTGNSPSPEWAFEGVEGYIFPRYLPHPAYTVPLYRFYGDKYADHVYTASETERASLAGNFLYASEGVAGYVIPADKNIPGTVPLYRYVREHTSGNRLFRDHFYSLSSNVPANYTSEGIACRVWQDAVQLPDELLQIQNPVAKAHWVKGSVQTISWSVWTGGGYLNLYYSTNSGQSWTKFATVSLQQQYGQVINGNYKWTLPGSLTGSLRIKLDWVESPGSWGLPLASVQSPDMAIKDTGITVVPMAPHPLNLP